MEKFKEALRQYLQEHPMETRCPNIDGILDMLQCCYWQNLGQEPEYILKEYRKVDALLEELPLEAQNDIFNVTCRLCSSYEKKAFQDGLLVGFRLCGELLE